MLSSEVGLNMPSWLSFVVVVLVVVAVPNGFVIVKPWTGEAVLAIQGWMGGSESRAQGRNGMGGKWRKCDAVYDDCDCGCDDVRPFPPTCLSRIAFRLKSWVMWRR